ncbi:hypothetical protein C922_05720 [Plasmodium inui San Antonio 1]|uniref:Uncharacterized protein n=1 Tax=Plasmodium inui San Antonio 1 TaxID=1237626 RepID=W6ZXB2_9APIC|nr:hypothetical protein C922_05720 [Plasmodium inui San Antonio 1]EUD63900.1 hypothetical protein C922_05720 [Plasmodium inui San Antonio 1]
MEIGDESSILNIKEERVQRNTWYHQKQQISSNSRTLNKNHVKQVLTQCSINPYSTYLKKEQQG